MLELIQNIDKAAYADYEKADRDLLQYILDKLDKLEDNYYYDIGKLHQRIREKMHIEFSRYANSNFDLFAFLIIMHQLKYFDGLTVTYSADYAQIKILHKLYWLDFEAWKAKNFERQQDRVFRSRKNNGEIKPARAMEASPNKQANQEKEKQPKKQVLFA